MGTTKIKPVNFKKWCRLLFISAIIAFPILLLSFSISNLRWSFGSEKAQLTWFEHLRRSRGYAVNDSTIADSLLLIDVHYDRTLVNINSESGMLGGSEAVVNHNHLLTLLRELKAVGNYHYILLDVFLDAEVSQPADTALYQLIATMPRIVIPTPLGHIADNCLIKKSAKAQYGTAIWESDFVKYPYWTDSEKSIPLFMYEELTGNHIQECGPILYDGSHIVRNNTILTYSVTESEQLMDGRFYMDMIVTDTADTQPFFTPDMTEGKYILIGDFKDDRHNTYLGEMSGTFINFNAYLSLVNGHHRLSMRVLLLIYAVFTLLVLVTIHHSTFSRKVMWLGYPSVLGISFMFIYFWYNMAYDVLWTSILFYVLEKLNLLWEIRKKTKENIKYAFHKTIEIIKNSIIWLRKKMASHK